MSDGAASRSAAIPNALQAVPLTTRPALASLRTKLSPPLASGSEIRRERLFAAVMAQQQARLVVLRAPAGFGKTTAMAHIRIEHEHLGMRTAWLTLDASDNDPSRFLLALRCVVDDITGQASSPTALSDTPNIYRLSDCDQPFTLFLDEFEALHESRVLDWIRELISQLPPQGRVIIGSRTLPDLRLARLRALGQLVEIDAAQLRFSEIEARQLLAAGQRATITPEQVTALHRKTEGWVTGLRLAAMALERPGSTSEFIGRFSGSNLSVADYLLSEVLEQQSAETREFLLRTSILRILSPELCTVLMPEVDSVRMLRDLSARNVLITTVDAQQHSYRYHSLFVDFLLTELKNRSPQELAALHDKAGQYYLQSGRPVPAVDHYLDGGWADKALPLMARHCPDLLAQGRLRLLARWFARIPPEDLDPWPELHMIRLWTLCLTAGAAEADAELQRTGLAGSGNPLVIAHLNALRIAMYSMRDQVDEACREGREFLRHLPSGNAWADRALINVMSTVFSEAGESARTLELIKAGWLTQSGHKGQLHQMHSEVLEGMVDLLAGRIYEAHARFRTALTASQLNDRALSGNTFAALYYALTLYERNQLPQASELLRAHLPLTRDLGLADQIICSYRMLARMAFIAGEVDEAFRLLAELELLGHKRQLPRVQASARLERSRIQLLQGKFQAADSELQRAFADGTSVRTREQRLTANEVDYELLARWRWQTITGDARTAASGLASEIKAAQTAGRMRRAMALRLVQAMALARSGQDLASRKLLEQTLQDCHANGIVRTVLDEGPILGDLIRQLHARAVSGNAVLSNARFVGYLAELLDGFGATLAPEAPEGSKPVLLDPLTDKEIQVLHLLAEGYSNVAMAEKLGVSDSTVRTHLRNVNSKFAVSSRMQAVIAARRLGVLR